MFLYVNLKLAHRFTFYTSDHNVHAHQWLSEAATTLERDLIALFSRTNV